GTACLAGLAIANGLLILAEKDLSLHQRVDKLFSARVNRGSGTYGLAVPQLQAILREGRTQDASAKTLHPRPIVRRHPHVGVHVEPVCGIRLLRRSASEYLMSR